jgi:hypothetical protein
MKVAKYLSGAVMALGLFVTLAAVQPATADSFAPADPHWGGESGRLWCTYERQITAYNPTTGQSWQGGYTYNIYRDEYGNFYYEGLNEANAEIVELQAEGFSGNWQDYCIASGTW